MRHRIKGTKPADHYLPALTIARTTDMKDELVFMTDNIDLGSISMRSFVFHN